MANKPVEALIRCPFYKEEKGTLLACEGYEPSTCMITRFPDAAAKRGHLRRNCFFENGGGCFLARSLFEKYEALERAETLARQKALRARRDAKN